VLVGLVTSTVLEDLNPDDQLVTRMRRQGAYVTDDEPIRAVGSLPVELGDRLGGDVEPEQVESAGEQWDEIAPVATADAEPLGQSVAAASGQDVLDEPDRRLVSVAPGGVLDIPGCRSLLVHAERA
jgi:hypothetical protein